MKKFSKILISAALIIVLIFHLVFTYKIKYNNQLLSLSDFSLYNIGNMLNLLVIVLLGIGLFVYGVQKKNKLPVSRVILFTAIISILLAAAYYSTTVDLPFQKIYYFGQHGNKLFVGLLFIIYITLLLTFTSYIWLSIFGRTSLIFTRSLLNSFIILFILLLFAFYTVNISDPSIDNEMIEADERNIAVVLGAAVWSNNRPSTILAARVDKALQLLDSNIVGKIQLTGSNAPGEFSEAVVAYNYAVSKGADPSKFLIEKNTTSTYEQIQFIRKVLMPKETINNVIVVSDNFHLVRIEEISKFHKIKIYAVASDLKLSFDKEIYNRLRESIGLIFFWFFAI